MSMKDGSMSAGLALCALVIGLGGGAACAETVLLAKWDDPNTLDATYSLFGSVAFHSDMKLRDHKIDGDSPQGGPHVRGVAGKWGGGVCCADADNAETDGNGDGVSKICGGWFSLQDNFNLPEGTLEFWFKPDWDSQAGQAPHMLFTTGSHVGPGTGSQDLIYVMWYWHEARGRGHLQGAWVGSGGGDDPYIILGEYELDEGAFARDTWHHVALSWNATRGRFFVDGKRALLSCHENLQRREMPEGAQFILGGSDTSIHIGSPVQPANGTYDNFRVSDDMLYAPDEDFTPPSDFPVPVPPAVKRIDLGGGIRMDMVLVRPGGFTMGSAGGDGGQRRVRPVRMTTPYYIGKYEVTQAQWQAVMGGNPSRHKDPRGPVDNVSWNDCSEFLDRLRAKTGKGSFRLPTEAEWEYACRAGRQTEYAFGRSQRELGTYAWFRKNAGGGPHPVGSKEPNAWGLHDMHGNVSEWCHDPFADDPSRLDREDPVARGSGNALGHALRGGAFTSSAAQCRSAVRVRSSRQERIAGAGLRCVMAADVWPSPRRDTIVRPLHIFAHRGGGRVFAPDSSMPNMEHAMTLGVTGIEIDLRLTQDGHLVLWHDDEIDANWLYLPGGARPNQTHLNRMTLADVKRLRYKGWVNGRQQELRIVPADEAIAKFKHQTNFYLDVKNVPVEKVLELVDRHDIAERSIVLAMEKEYLRKVRAADPRITLCYWAGIPNDPAAACTLVKEVADMGVEIFGSPGLTDAKVALCHEYGVSVRPSGGDVLYSDGKRFLLMGVDGLIPDHPAHALDAVERLWGKPYLPRKGQTVYELLQPLRKRRRGAAVQR